MELLRIENVSKSFPGVQALRNVNISIEKGEVHALVGENGAGKSTLMHIIAGVYRADTGKIFLDGNEIKLRDEIDAQKAGIGIVFQERSLVENLSIAENIFVTRQPVTKTGLIDKREMNAQASILLEKVGFKIDPSISLARLTPVMKQLVEIAKALSLNPKILILDEPTATISEREVDILFSLIKQLKQRGISIIYISHRLQEISGICDKVSVLKDGVYQGTKNVSEVTLDEIVRMMVGREVLNIYEDRKNTETEIVLEVKNLSSRAFKNINFKLKKKEIFGISGLIGAGRSELALALFGSDNKATGEIYVKGKKVNFKIPADAIKAGIGYLTEDRKESGVFLGLDVSENIFSSNMERVTKFGIVNDSRLKKLSKEFVNKLKIITPSLKQKVLNLSGGNQQKLLLARWLLKNPDILIVDEPTRGVDIGVKSEIYQLLRKIADSGTSIIVISSELPEILNLCDRIMTMWQGKKTGELTHLEATEEKLMQLSAGLNSKLENNN
ncbi:MAG: sugar ABC transporter ATP-binding protein [Candidatus Humimicrobiaceae bacterium]